MARDELLDPTPRDDDDLVEGDVDGHPEGAATDLTVAGELTGDASIGREPAPPDARRVRRSVGAEAPTVDHPRGGPPPGPVGRPLPLRRATRARQDVAGRDRRPRDGGDDARDLRSRPRAPGRPGRHPDQARRHRRPVHRRDPPPVALGRGGALPGDGGLRARHRARKGAGRPVDPTRPSPVLPRRRDHPDGPDHRPAPRPVRARRPPRLLRAGRPARRSWCGRRSSSAPTSTATARPRSRAAHGDAPHRQPAPASCARRRRGRG